MRRLQIALFAFALALTCSVPVTARADDDARERARKAEARGYGYQSGYRDGYQRGRDDRDRRGRFEMESDDYKKADRGYAKSMGEKERYKKGYREGYQIGYDDGYNLRAARFGNSSAPVTVVVPGRESAVVVPGREPAVIVPGEPATVPGRVESSDAFEIGYRDGQIDGRRDFTDNRGYHPEDHSLYRDADHGFTSALADRDTFKRRFRDGYLEGYRTAYGR